MKKMMSKSICALTVAAAIASCSGDTKKTDNTAVPAKTETKAESKTVNGANQSGTAGATVALVQAMVEKDWKAVNGQEVTVTAYPIGATKTEKNGEFYLYIADKQGDATMHFDASFK